MKSNVFNNRIGAPYSFDYPTLNKKQELEIISGLFEQLLIFDQVTITTNRVNFALAFLINKLGVNTVEKLFRNGYIKIMLWTPLIFTSSGHRTDNEQIDHASIYGKPPIAAGTFSSQDLDPEKNIDYALRNFGLHRERKRLFTKIAAKNYIIPNGMEFSSGSAELVISAYKKNDLASLGLPFENEPEQMHLDERRLLLSLGNKVIETAVLSKYNLKSYENYEHFAICKQHLDNIGKAYNVANNTAELFNLEDLPNLKELYISQRLDFDRVFKIRHLSNAKYYRKWINTVGENSNAKEITKEYLNEIKGNSKFFEQTEGKLIKHLSLLAANSAIGTLIAGPIGTVSGLGLGFFEALWLDNILKGKNPSMFIDYIKKEIDTDE